MEHSPVIDISQDLTWRDSQRHETIKLTKCLYPTSNAVFTAAAASPDAAFHVPNPTAGILAPVFKVNVVIL